MIIIIINGPLTTKELKFQFFPFRSWFQRQQTCPTCRLNILRTPITASQPQQQQQQPLINNNAVNQNARPNEAAAGAQQNPFLNLLNQTGLGNQQAPAASTSASMSAPQTIPNLGATMPPPFFFPSMPFMAPYTIPPPPMPQNLDQLTVEELRAMEGNERRHVEERLKLLRNVQTMLNASAALMNQYQMVVANLPPLPIPPPPPAPTAGAEESTKPEEKASEVGQSQVKLEDVGSEDHFEEASNKSTSASSQPSTSKLTALESPSPATVTSTFLANESSATNGESEEANEIRKRRLQKFMQTD